MQNKLIQRIKTAEALKKILKAKLKEDRRNITWFWEIKLMHVEDLTYSKLTSILRGLSPMREELQAKIDEYLAG